MDPDIPADLPNRMNAAMKEIGFEVSPEQPRFSRQQAEPPPHIFWREYA